ncbi:MAG: ABC-2 family transporter protein [Clostridia bacterium]|nr:ABC-2 family transporter protein [Clostridia bacterium]
MLYVALARASIRKNMAYAWAHMANNVGSALFGIIYIMLWRAAAHGRPLGAFSARDLESYIAVGQVVLWLTTFLPPYLGIDRHIRTGQIALEFARPVGYMPRVLAAAAGEVAYNAVFRCLPLLVMFTLMGAFPWDKVASPARVAAVAAAFALAAAIGLLVQYLVGIAGFWTTESRWARRLYFALAMFCGGQLFPLQLMPAGLREALTWLPFQAMISFPVSVWLGVDSWQAWTSAALWVAGLAWVGAGLTRKAARRLEVQGG